MCLLFVVCTALKDGISILLDLTWTGLDEVFQIINGTGLPYIRAEPEIVPFLRTLDRTITDTRDVVDAALIFQDAQGTVLTRLIPSSISTMDIICL